MWMEGIRSHEVYVLKVLNLKEIVKTCYRAGL